MASTKIELVEVLDEFLSKDDPVVSNIDHIKVQAIIVKAQGGYYHDFESKVAFPKMTLIKELQEAGLFEIAERTAQGEFDE
ncbi:hypothetical protein HY357_02815 [Candidatus Roizmanbacteria bacterium]|nr:hypothetical protein [Candidatus Roizmanbacteria bacterium]